MRLFFSVLAALIPCLAFGQDVPLEIRGDGITVVKVDKVIVVKEDRTLATKFPFTIQAPKGSGLYFWSYPAGVLATDLGDKLEITAAPKGRLLVSVKSISADVDKDGKFKGFITRLGRIDLDVGEVTPEPGPGPKPDPLPPSPLPDPGLRVLFVYESMDTTPAVQTILGAAAVRDYLNQKCVKDESGKAAWRIYDKDVPLAADAPWVKRAMDRPRQGLPWVLVSNGKAGFEGPLPKSVDDVLALVKKYEGANP